MLFKCVRDCYDNQRCIGYKFQDVYSLTLEDIEVMKSNGLFPKVFEPADFEAQQFMKPQEALIDPDMDSTGMAESENADSPAKRGRRGV